MGEYIGLNYFFDAHQRIYWLYLISALVISVSFLYFAPIFVKRQFSKEVLLHKSAKLDYLYFVVMSILKVLIIMPLMISVTDVILWGVHTLQDTFGYFERIHASKEILILSYTLVVFVVNDFTRYWTHRLLHLVPFLWRFHRIHHSAEVLNPLTFYRVHPVENILFGLRYAFTTGFITAIFIYFFGAGINMVEILGVNVFIFVFGLLGTNLRHSHIPLSYGKKLERFFISPYLHQLHHTTEFTHKNFGSYLAIWDLWFGTLVREKKENLVYGLKGEKINHSLFGLFVNPFIKGIKL